MFPEAIAEVFFFFLLFKAFLQWAFSANKTARKVSQKRIRNGHHSPFGCVQILAPGQTKTTNKKKKFKMTTTKICTPAGGFVDGPGLPAAKLAMLIDLSIFFGDYQAAMNQRNFDYFSLSSSMKVAFFWGFVCLCAWKIACDFVGNDRSFLQPNCKICKLGQIDSNGVPYAS